MATTPHAQDTLYRLLKFDGDIIKQVVKILSECKSNEEALNLIHPPRNDVYGVSALLMAAKDERSEILSIFARVKGVDLDGKPPPNYSSELDRLGAPLWYACAYKREKCVRILSKHGADPNYKRRSNTARKIQLF